MEGIPNEPTYERNEQRTEDIKFIRTFLRAMDQTRVMRWKDSDEERFKTPDEAREMNESVAEHVGSMVSLITYIMLKAKYEEDETTTQLNLHTVQTMVCLHDIPENLVGDTKLKNKSYYEAEEHAYTVINTEMEKLNFGKDLKGSIEEYESKASAEARFVKAIDELQAMFYMMYARGFEHSNRDYNHQENIAGLVYAKEFPTVDRLSKILVKIIANPKFISSEIPNLTLLQEQYKNEN